MVKLIDEHEYDFESGLFSIPKGGGLTLIVLEDEEGDIQTIAMPTIKDVEELCEQHDLDVEMLMSHIAAIQDESVSLLIRLSEYRRTHDVAKRHAPMTLRLYYLPPHGEIVTSPVEVDSFEEYWFWLNNFVAGNPDTIFFFTTETTDIFEED